MKTRRKPVHGADIPTKKYVLKIHQKYVCDLYSVNDRVVSFFLGHIFVHSYSATIQI
jgi:hypothetical protein